MKKTAKMNLLCLSSIVLFVLLFAVFPGFLTSQDASADNSVDIDVTNWEDWYVYDHYDSEGGYSKTDSRFTDKRPYFEILENQAINNGDITTIPDLLNGGSWRYVHHLMEHISLVTIPKKGFEIYDIVFMGYGEEPYTDFLIYPETSGGEKSFGYDIYALNIDTHTLSSAGFLLNAGIDEDGYIHGYVLLIGFPESSSGGSFDGARMYLYKILEKGDTDSYGNVSAGVKAADIHHPVNYPAGAFTNQGNLQANQLPEMDIAVDGRTTVLLDTDGDGNPDYLGFRQSGSVADSVMALIYDDSGNIIAQVVVDGEDIAIDGDGTMLFYDDKPFHLDDDRVSEMSMPMDISLDDPNVTVVDADVIIEGSSPISIDGDNYVISGDGVYVKEAGESDPGYSDNYWIGRPGRWGNASFVPGNSWVSAGGTVYTLDDDLYYLEGNNLYIRDDTGAGQFESFWIGNFTILSGKVVLNGAPAVPFDPSIMWLEQISGWGNMLCVIHPSTGVLSTYMLDGTHNYFTTDSLVELRYGNPEAGIPPGVYTLDGTEAFLDNGYLLVRKNIHYHQIYIDGTTNFVVDGSQFKLKTGQIVKTDGTNVTFYYGSLVISGDRPLYTLHYWSNDTYPDSMEIQLKNHEVLQDGTYTLGLNSVGWSERYLTVPLSLYVIDGEDLFIENGKEIKVSGELLYIFFGGVDTGEPGRVEIFSESGSSSEINEIVPLDGTKNYIKEDNDNIVHLAPRADRYSFNSNNLTHVGTLTNPGEFFAPDGQRTSVLHLNVSFTDNELTITSSTPGSGIDGNDSNTIAAKIVYNESLSFQSDGTYRGFGPYVEYQSHGCNSLTSFRFSNMTMGAVPQHKVIFDANAPAVETTPGILTFIEIDEGSKIGALPNDAEPTRLGYTFQGWAKTPYATTPDFNGESERMGFADITVYAVWQANPVEVIFYATPTSLGYDTANPYTVGNEANTGKHYGDKLTSFTAPEPRYEAGYTLFFDGWYLDSDCLTGLWDFANDIITSDKTDVEGQLLLYAKWKTSVATPSSLFFDENGGTAGTTMSKTVESGEKAGTLPSAESGDAPTREKYDFVGWSELDDAQIPDFDENNTVDGNKTVYAVWKPKSKVIYDPNGAIPDPAIPDEQYADNGTIKLPLNEPTREGYIFTGWNTESDGSGTPYDDPGKLIDITKDVAFNGTTGELTLYAQWKPIFEVKVNDSEADIKGDGSYKAGDTVTINAGNKSSDWVFLGWEVTTAVGGVHIDPEDIGIDVNSKKTTFTMPDNDVVVTAVWHQFTEADFILPQSEIFDVVFDANGGHPYHTETIEGGQPVAKPANDPVRDGHEFLGWYTAEIGGTLWDFKNLITGDTVLYAHWKDNSHPEPETYTVSFDLQTGSPLTSVNNVSEGATVAKPTAPSRPGYTFLGWFTAPSGGREWDFQTDIIEHDRTLYAHWEEIQHPVIVTFDSQSGSAVAPATVEKGRPAAKPVNPTKSGYTFQGWYTAASGGDLWDFTKPIEGDMTLYAHWETPSSEPGYSGSGTPTETRTETPALPNTNSETPTDSNTETDDSTAPPTTPPAGQPSGQQQELPQNMLLPEGSTRADFPDIDLDAHQPDLTTPGGTDHFAPPVPNYANDMLMLQIDEDGNIFFFEITDPNSPPLGMWMWSEDDNMWVFIDNAPPLAQIPQTGLYEVEGWLALAGLAMIAAAIILNRQKRRLL